MTLVRFRSLRSEMDSMTNVGWVLVLAPATESGQVPYLKSTKASARWPTTEKREFPSRVEQLERQKLLLLPGQFLNDVSIAPAMLADLISARRMHELKRMRYLTQARMLKRMAPSAPVRVP
jgi:hypothetical protein